MSSARVVVATDSGLAHLALLCDRPLILISHGEGCTAPGYRIINAQRYAQSNHRQAPLKVVSHSWERPDYVMAAVAEFLGDVPDNYHYWVNRYEKLGPDRTVCDCRGCNLRERTAWVVRELTKFLPERCERLLDFGCGNGRLAPFLQTRCAHYYGTDILPAAIADALQNSAGNFALMERGRIPFPGVRFDVITTVTVLQHIVDEELFASILDQFAVRIRHGGVLVMCENVARRPDLSYIKFRRAEDYVLALSEAGFAVSRISDGGQDFEAHDFPRVDELAMDQQCEVHALIKAIKR